MDLKSDNIGQKYNLNKEDLDDPATKEWCKLIDLNTVIKSELDWHSTRTFELFLDALDVNQIVIGDDKKSKSNRDARKTHDKTSPNDEAKDKIVDATKHNRFEEKITSSTCAIKTNSDTYQGAETILSAEALKILSELPDLSHMSSSRSFMFPGHNKVRK